jgi:hypothetical protein
MVDGDAAAEKLVRSLVTTGYALVGSVEHDNGRLATVRLTRAADGTDVIVDLLFASSGIEPEVVLAAEALELTPGLVAMQSVGLIEARGFNRERDLRKALDDLVTDTAHRGPHRRDS